jgi:hypothetical protein
MANDAQKLNYGVKDSQTANKQAAGRVQNYPKDLPVSVVKIDKSNTIMTLKFETQGTALGPWTLPNITVPLSGPEYIRYPIRPASGQTAGDKGFATTAAANIGNISGLGPMTPANFTAPGNLASTIFTLMGNSSFTPTDDQTALMGYGPTGTVHRDTNKKAKHVVHPTNGITSSTGAQGQTGPTSNPTYNMTSLLHPLNGLLHTIMDSQNGNHTASIIPSGGSGGPIGLLLSMFGGKHTHSIGQSGHQLTSSSQVNVTAPTTDINSSQTNISGNTSITGILRAIGGMFSGGGGGGGGGGISPSGAVTGSSVAVTGVATSAAVLTTPYTVSALNTAYPPASNRGLRAYVIDVSGSPTWMTTTLAGGGAAVYPAFCNGLAWVAG